MGNIFNFSKRNNTYTLTDFTLEIDDNYLKDYCKSSRFLNYKVDNTIDFMIPHSYKSKPVIAIGEDALRDSYLISSFVGGKTLRTIGKNSFNNCINLHSVRLEEGVEIIEEGAFKDCESLETVFLPKSLKSIGKNAFANCINLKYIDISNVEYVAEDAFTNCTLLSKIFSKKEIDLYMSERKPSMILLNDFLFICNSLSDLTCVDIPNRKHVVIPASISNKKVTKVKLGNYKDVVDSVISKITIPRYVKSLNSLSKNILSSLQELIVISEETKINKGLLQYCSDEPYYI